MESHVAKLLYLPGHRLSYVACAQCTVLATMNRLIAQLSAYIVAHFTNEPCSIKTDRFSERRREPIFKGNRII